MNNSAAQNELSDKILKVLSMLTSDLGRPVSVGEISSELNIPVITAARTLQNLINEGKIQKITSSNGKYTYYTSQQNAETIDKVLQRNYVDMIEPLKKECADIKEENKKLKEQIDHLYANILTIMGIFVAIFALIVINVTAIGNFGASITGVDQMFMALIKLNIPLVIAMVVLFILIRIVIRPFKRKKKGDSL